MVGWSLLEGVGAALILPAIVALVASNSPGRSGHAPTGSSPQRVRSRWRPDP